MIRINKAPANDAPASFKRRGKKRTQTECNLFDSNPNDYLNNVTPFIEVMESIYQSKLEVKTKLNESHHFKCCYCETKFNFTRDLEVEHFRPKRYSRQSPNSRIIPLVYFWLAYDWDNLLLSCAACNRDHKKNLFPLEDEANRASPRTRNIENEEPIFINPSKEDPREHIRFVDEVPIPYASSTRGQITIEYLGLLTNHILINKRIDHLKEVRKHLKNLARWRKLLILSQETKNAEIEELAREAEEDGIEAVIFLNNAKKNSAQFSSMTQDFLAQQSF
jgi:uncharacterized protein (TIGR02646 family)